MSSRVLQAVCAIYAECRAFPLSESHHRRTRRPVGDLDKQAESASRSSITSRLVPPVRGTARCTRLPLPSEGGDVGGASLTSLTLSCAARAVRLQDQRRGGCCRAVSIRADAICSHRDAERVLFGPGGSAAGPTPGRDGFSVKLGGQPARRLLIITYCRVSRSHPARGPSRICCRSNGVGFWSRVALA